MKSHNVSDMSLSKLARLSLPRDRFDSILLEFIAF